MAEKPKVAGKVTIETNGDETITQRLSQSVIVALVQSTRMGQTRCSCSSRHQSTPTAN